MTNSSHSKGSLLKGLGIAFGLAVLVGNSIGMGILRTPGGVAALLPSIPLFMLVWAIGALYALLGALSVAELATMHPASGGLFPLVLRGLGPFAGFVSGWTDWISTCGSLAAVSIVLGEYAAPLIPGALGHESLIAAAVVVAFMLLQWRGVRMGDVAQQISSLLKAIGLVALAVVAIVMGRGDAATTAAVAAAPVSLPAGLALFTALIVALQSVIYTYDGWSGPIYFGEEIKDPSHDIPRTMIGGMLLVMVIYLLLNAAFLRVLPIQEMAGDPFVAASAAKRLFGERGDFILRIVMILSLVATCNALLLMASRVPYAMSRAGLMPASLDQVNAGGTPVRAHVLSAVVALLFIATQSFDIVLALLAFLFVANYAITFVSLFLLRRREPNAARPFRVPGYPWVPGIALAGSIAFMLSSLYSDRNNSLGALALVAGSWPAYRLMRRYTAGA